METRRKRGREREEEREGEGGRGRERKGEREGTHTYTHTPDIIAKRWLEQDRDSINRHLDIIAVYMFSPFFYGHAHQTDKVTFHIDPFVSMVTCVGDTTYTRKYEHDILR